MISGLYTEDALVKKTTADYLEQHLGWQTVYAHNAENFDPDGLLGRNSDREVVLTRPFRSKLVELNPGLLDAAYDEAVQQVAAISAAQTLSTTNRGKYALIRDGVPVAFRNHRDERVRQRLRVFDFNHGRGREGTETDLPVARYPEDDVQTRTEEVYANVFHVYPTLPSPYYRYEAAG
jgi:hypothetical protein